MVLVSLLEKEVVIVLQQFYIFLENCLTILNYIKPKFCSPHAAAFVLMDKLPTVREPNAQVIQQSIKE